MWLGVVFLIFVEMNNGGGGGLDRGDGDPG
jgi:hypothetical protein